MTYPIMFRFSWDDDLRKGVLRDEHGLTLVDEHNRPANPGFPPVLVTEDPEIGCAALPEQVAHVNALLEPEDAIPDILYRAKAVGYHVRILRRGQLGQDL